MKNRRKTENKKSYGRRSPATILYYTTKEIKSYGRRLVRHFLARALSSGEVPRAGKNSLSKRLAVRGLGKNASNNRVAKKAMKRPQSKAGMREARCYSLLERTRRDGNNMMYKYIRFF